MEKLNVIVCQGQLFLAVNGGVTSMFDIFNQWKKGKTPEFPATLINRKLELAVMETIHILRKGIVLLVKLDLESTMSV